MVSGITDHHLTVEEEIKRPFFGRPHLVILGAGASRASFPNGEATGRRLPLVADLVEYVGLHDLLRSMGVAYEGKNFEDVFSDLHQEAPVLVRQVEEAIHEYFSGMLLPREPTLYDHLVLSLREKDVVATFASTLGRATPLGTSRWENRRDLMEVIHARSRGSTCTSRPWWGVRVTTAGRAP